MTRTCILVSPYFPPSTLAGVHRARHLARHLPAAGWTPLVVCVDEAFHEQRLDPHLAHLVPSTVEIAKVPALSARLTRPLGIGEIGLRAFAPLRRTLVRLLATRSVDGVLITGPPHYPMLMAPELRRRFGVPVILDFQDPWVSAWGASQPRLSKPGLSQALARMLEPRALRGASYVTSVSQIQNDELAACHPWLDRRRMAAIPIGADRQDFEGLDHDNAIALEPGMVHLCYVGTIWPPVLPTLNALLRAVRLLRLRNEPIYRRLRLHFVGTTGSPNGTGHRVLPLACPVGVDEIIRETPERLAYRDALSLLARSHASLMIGSNAPHYTASKAYLSLMSGRPWLSVFHRASSAHAVLCDSGGGIALAFSNDAELAALDGPICDAIVRLAQAPASLGRADPAVVARFEASAIARRFADVFDSLQHERLEARRCA